MALDFLKGVLKSAGETLDRANLSIVVTDAEGVFSRVLIRCNSN